MAIDQGTKQSTKRSCQSCRKRHLKCAPIVQPDGSVSCVWCMEHGFECVQQGDDASQRTTTKPPNDGSIIMNGATSAFGGFQLSKQSFFSSESGVENLLRIRQEMTEKSTVPWLETDGLEEELRLDKVVIRHLEKLFFDTVQPYIPVITRSYCNSVQPSQLLLAAMYGIAARLPEAVISSRDFLHIKRVLQNQLAKLINAYEPSLQACIALTLIHLTLELHSDGIEGVEAWPLRLGMAVRMALELKLNRQSTYASDDPDLQEMKRRLFWAVFTKDRWTSTGKGYPLMMSLLDVDIEMPTSDNLDGSSLPQHEFFVELVHQAIVLGKLHRICFRPDRFVHVTMEAFREVEREVDELGHRLRRVADRCDSETRANLELNYTALRLLFYSPFFRPASDSESNLFSTFVPNLAQMRLQLARDAVYALEFTSKDVILKGPSIWSIVLYAQVRCFLVALSIKHDETTDYPPELRKDACDAVDKVIGIAHHMCEDKKWSFMILSGTLVLFSAKVAEQKAESRSRGDTPEAMTMSKVAAVRKSQIEGVPLQAAANQMAGPAPTSSPNPKPNNLKRKQASQVEQAANVKQQQQQQQIRTVPSQDEAYQYHHAIQQQAQIHPQQPQIHSQSEMSQTYANAPHIGQHQQTVLSIPQLHHALPSQPTNTSSFQQNTHHHHPSGMIGATTDHHQMASPYDPNTMTRTSGHDNLITMTSASSVAPTYVAHNASPINQQMGNYANNWNCHWDLGGEFMDGVIDGIPNTTPITYFELMADSNRFLQGTNPYQ